jgi:hypothetical protein
MNVSDYKVWKLLDIYVDEARFNQDLSNIDTFGLDETSVAKGHPFECVVECYFNGVTHSGFERTNFCNEYQIYF